MSETSTVLLGTRPAGLTCSKVTQTDDSQGRPTAAGHQVNHTRYDDNQADVEPRETNMRSLTVT